MWKWVMLLLIPFLSKIPLKKLHMTSTKQNTPVTHFVRGITDRWMNEQLLDQPPAHLTAHCGPPRPRVVSGKFYKNIWACQWITLFFFWHFYRVHLSETFHQAESSNSHLLHRPRAASAPLHLNWFFFHRLKLLISSNKSKSEVKDYCNIFNPLMTWYIGKFGSETITAHSWERCTVSTSKRTVI